MNSLNTLDLMRVLTVETRKKTETILIRFHKTLFECFTTGYDSLGDYDQQFLKSEISKCMCVKLGTSIAL